MIIHPNLPQWQRAPKKRDFHIDDMLDRIADAVEEHPREVLFQLYDEGFRTAFELVVASVLTSGTPDEVSLRAAQKLFQRARTPQDVARLDVADIGELIQPVAFCKQKAQHIHEIAHCVVEKYGGNLPCRERVIASLKGVGPKCSNLVMTLACGQPRIAVGTHMQRVVNRWGFVNAESSSGTERQLCEKVDKEKWVELNQHLPPFAKYICTTERPKCSTCPVLEYCRQVGVENPR